ncbi:hypothetical protein QQG55_41395 [Brugia pahangi]
MNIREYISNDLEFNERLPNTTRLILIKIVFLVSTGFMNWITNWSKSYTVCIEATRIKKYTLQRFEEIRRAHFTLRYTPSANNPVEVATRGISPSKLKNYQPWWTRPQ